MIIPNDDDQEQPKQTRDTSRVSLVKVSTNYQKKVDAMLVKMSIDQTIRIGRICKPENREMFVQAVKNFITSTNEGGGILFGNDWKTFRRSEMSHEWKPNKLFDATKPKINDPEIIKERDALIQWFGKYSKTSGNKRFVIGCSIYTDPNRFVSNLVANTKNTHTSSAPFKAAIHHLQTIKNFLK
jgi:hypothetical protein